MYVFAFTEHQLCFTLKNIDISLIVSDKYHMAYKLVKTECKLVRSILNGHGFHEVSLI